MSRFSAKPGLWAVLLAGCVGPGGTSAPEPSSRESGNEIAGDTSPGAQAVEASARQSEGTVNGRGSQVRTDAPVIDLDPLRDPAFRARFLESYIADTDMEPAMTPAEREVMQKVLALIADEKVDAAAEMLDQHRSPQASAVFDFARGNVYQQQERLEAAAAAYQTAADKHPKFRRAWTSLAQLEYRRGEFARALPAFARVVEQGGADALSLGLLGVCHAKTENYVAAESAFRMAMVMDPRAMEWKWGLAESLFRQARYLDAAALLQAMIAEHPERPDLWRLQGEAYAMSEQPLRAAQNFEMVARLGAATPELFENLGLIYARQGIYDLSVDSYLAAIDKKRDGNLEPVLRTARYLSGTGAHVEVSRLVEGIEALRGDNLTQDQRKELLRIRARIAAATGASDEEAQILAKIVEVDPLDGDALVLLGRHCGRKGEYEKAAFWFERAEGLEAFEAEAKLRHGELLVKQGQYAQALPYLRRSLDLRPREDVRKYFDQIERSVQGR